MGVFANKILFCPCAFVPLTPFSKSTEVAFDWTELYELSSHYGANKMAK
jgi:hypothetical protein